MDGKRMSVHDAGKTLLSALQIALVGGCVVLNYLANNYLGIAEFISLQSARMEQAVNMPMLLSLAAIVVLMACVAVTAAVHNRFVRMFNEGACTALIWVLGLLFVSLALVLTRDAVLAYYYLCFMLGAAALLQFVKAYLSTLQAK